MTPETTEQAVFNFNLLNALVSWAGLATAAAALIKAFRRDPPFEEQALEKFATKDDVDKVRAELTQLRTDLGAQLKSGNTLFRDIEGAIGRLNGLMERCPYYCAPRGTPGRG
jgi:hypothetical protein